MGLIVRYHFVPRLISASHVETPALIRDQLQVRLDNYRVEVLDTSVVLRTKFQVSIIYTFVAKQKSVLFKKSHDES